MESLTGFNVFVQVAETRSFVAAGRMLGVSASAVGKRIARLEERLGVRLFHRSTRSITLTAEGSLFLERSKRILAEIEDAEHELSQHAQTPRGRLRVSTPLVGSLLLGILADFMREYPDIELDFEFTDRMVDVIEEGFDAVIRAGAPSDSRLVSRMLGRHRFRIVGSPAYFKEMGVPKKPTDLLDHRLLHYRFQSSGKREPWPLRVPPGEAPLDLPSHMTCNDTEARVCFAIHGRGLALIPSFAAHDALIDGSLVAVMDDWLEHSGEFRILWPAGRQMPPKLRVFVDFLASRVFPEPPANQRRRRQTTVCT